MKLPEVFEWPVHGKLNARDRRTTGLECFPLLLQSELLQFGELYSVFQNEVHV